MNILSPWQPNAITMPFTVASFCSFSRLCKSKSGEDCERTAYISVSCAVNSLVVMRKTAGVCKSNNAIVRPNLLTSHKQAFFPNETLALKSRKNSTLWKVMVLGCWFNIRDMNKVERERTARSVHPPSAQKLMSPRCPEHPCSVLWQVLQKPNSKSAPLADYT